jgi:stringent starvation protein A
MGGVAGGPFATVRDTERTRYPEGVMEVMGHGKGGMGNMTLMPNQRSVMTLYANPRDPVGHSVRIVLAEKDVNVEVNYVDDGDRPDDLAELNPYNLVLTLIDRDLVLYDAQIMMEYLDERFPHPPLMPVDPAARATNKQVRARLVRELYEAVAELENRTSRRHTEARRTMRDNITAIAPAFLQYPYFLSIDFSLVDCCVAPILWRLRRYGVQLPAQAKPVLKYAARLFQRTTFQASLSAVEREMSGLN